MAPLNNNQSTNGGTHTFWLKGHLDQSGFPSQVFFCPLVLWNSRSGFTRGTAEIGSLFHLIFTWLSVSAVVFQNTCDNHSNNRCASISFRLLRCSTLHLLQGNSSLSGLSQTQTEKLHMNFTNIISGLGGTIRCAAALHKTATEPKGYIRCLDKPQEKHGNNAEGGPRFARGQSMQGGLLILPQVIWLLLPLDLFKRVSGVPWLTRWLQPLPLRLSRQMKPGMDHLQTSSLRISEPLQLKASTHQTETCKL